MAKCVVCRERVAAVPDRDSMSLRKKVCRECHALRLAGDMRRVLELHDKRKLPTGGTNGNS